MNLAFCYIAMNVNEITNSSPEVLRKGASVTEDVSSGNKSFDGENISVTSSESNSVCITASPSQTVVVKNSADVHIGDRTYLTIQNAIPDSDTVEKIINKVIVSSKCKNDLNEEKVEDHLGSTCGFALDNVLNLVKDGAFVPTQNGGRGNPKDSSSKFLGKNWFNGDFTLCGHLINIKLILILIILLLVLVTGCILAILKRIADVDSSSSPLTSLPIFRPSTTIAQPDVLGTSNSSQSSASRPKDWYLITRKDWNAYETEMDDVYYLQHPVKNVIIAHTAGSICHTEVACSETMRGIQAWAVGNHNFEDIPYNFLVGGDGNAFEGLGWDIRGAHSKGYNSKSIGIAFIGNFVFVRPEPQQFEALKRLLAWGVEIGKLDPEYRLLPHNLTHATLSPGRFVYEEIKTWPHFTEERFYTD